MLCCSPQVQEQILEYASLKQNKDLKKGDGAKRGRVTGVASCTELHHASLLWPWDPIVGLCCIFIKRNGSAGFLQ